MKKLIIFLLFVIFSFSCFAQQAVREGNTFKVTATVTKDKETGFFWEDKEGNKYPIYISSRGACYIFRVSKNTGNKYKYYLPKEVQDTIKKELKK